MTLGSQGKHFYQCSYFDYAVEPTFVKQKLNDSLVSVPRGQVERGQAGLGQKVRVGSVVDQKPRDLDVAVSAGQVQRGHAALENQTGSFSVLGESY